jgi:hypothetical protein
MVPYSDDVLGAELDAAFQEYLRVLVKAYGLGWTI